MALESSAWVALALLFSTRLSLRGKFPFTTGYFYVRAVSCPILFLELYSQTFWKSGPINTWYVSYCYTYYIVYIVCSVLLFFISAEVFHTVMGRFPVLNRFGLSLFYVVAGGSVVFSLFQDILQRKVFDGVHGIQILIPLSTQIMRSISMIELVVLGFLCLGMTTLRLSVRDVSFGIAFGFEILAASDFIMATFVAWRWMSINDPREYLFETSILVALALFITYALLPERERDVEISPTPSMLSRMNEIAAALGPRNTIALPENRRSARLFEDGERRENPV
jgi:hypothetical protein